MALARALLAASLASAALPALPASAEEPPPPVRLIEERGRLRHAPTGFVLPRSIAGMKRALYYPGDPIVVVYEPPGLQPDDRRRFAIGIGPAEAPAPVERFRDDIRKRVGEGPSPETLSEGAFAWPGHPGAHTFHGSYRAGGMRIQYWHAWTNGEGILVMAEWPAEDPEQMEKVAAAVGRLFDPGR
ncbi:MAG TPA: hypothetical protein VF605_05445 [Allosphingosinicella sp.]